MDVRGRLGEYRIDHVIWAGPDLQAMTEAFEAVGFEPVYGGEHAHANTHNALIGLPDGTYIELLAPIEAGTRVERRGDLLADGAGPAGWAIQVPDIQNVTRRMAERGEAVDGPHGFSRAKPDGDVIEWSVTALGAPPAGSLLPFLIEDETPRDRRVPAPEGGPDLLGIERVLIGIPDVAAAIDTFRRAFDLPVPTLSRHDGLQARVATFPGSALILAESLSESGPIGRRVDRFGSLPAAFLLGVGDLDDLDGSCEIVETDKLSGSRIGWISVTGFDDRTLGVIER